VIRSILIIPNISMRFKNTPPPGPCQPILLFGGGRMYNSAKSGLPYIRSGLIADISVIVPLLLGRTLTKRFSVLGQTHADLELLIVDDGSRTGTHGLSFPTRKRRARQVLHQENKASARQERRAPRGQRGIRAFVDATTARLRAYEKMRGAQQNTAPLRGLRALAGLAGRARLTAALAGAGLPPAEETKENIVRPL
jgi:hypothetical protein